MDYFSKADDIRSECDALLAEINSVADSGGVEEANYSYYDRRELTKFEKQVNDAGKDAERLAAAGKRAFAQSERALKIAGHAALQAKEAGILALAIVGRIVEDRCGASLPESPDKRNPVQDLRIGSQMLDEQINLLSYILKNTTSFELRYSKNSGPGGVAYECSHTDAGRRLLRDLMDVMLPGRIDPDNPYAVRLIKRNAAVLELADRMAAADFRVPLGSTLAEVKEAAREWEHPKDKKREPYCPSRDAERETCSPSQAATR